MCFETYEYFKKYNIRDTKDGNFTLHDRPMEEDLLDFAAIFKLEFTDTVSQACRQILRQAASCQQPKHGSAPNPGKILWAMWRQNIKFYLSNKLTSLKEDEVNTILTVTTVDGNIQLTFYLQ